LELSKLEEQKNKNHAFSGSIKIRDSLLNDDKKVSFQIPPFFQNNIEGNSQKGK
jgi:hypothetical protein